MDEKMEQVKNIIRKAGYEIEKGIGSECEIFVSDENNTITCYVAPIFNSGMYEFSAAGSDEDAELTDYTYDFGDELDEKEIIGILKRAFRDEQNYIANGGEPLRRKG